MKQSVALGYTHEELLKLTVHDIDPSFPKGVWADHWSNLRAQQFLPLESTNRRKDGHIFPIEIWLNYLLYNGQEYNFAFARDLPSRSFSVFRSIGVAESSSRRC
jgi:nuclease A inhibitor-like protein